MQKDNPGRWLAILPIILALLGLVFGDNLYERYTGHSIFAPAQRSLPEEPKTVVIVVTATAQPQAPIPPTTTRLPPTPVPIAPTAIPTPTRMPQKVDTQLTGGGITQSYTVDLANGEILVGHAGNISFARGIYPQDYDAVAYLIVGPGRFKFEVFSGLWDKWVNSSSGLYKQLLQEQYNVPVVRDSHSPSRVQKVCRNINGYFDCP